MRGKRDIDSWMKLNWGFAHPKACRSCITANGGFLIVVEPHKKKLPQNPICKRQM